MYKSEVHRISWKLPFPLIIVHICVRTQVWYINAHTHMYACACMCVYVSIKARTPLSTCKWQKTTSKTSKLFPSRLRQTHFAVHIYAAYSELSSPPVRVTYLPQEHWKYRQPIFKSDFYMILGFSDPVFLVAWQVLLPIAQSPRVVNLTLSICFSPVVFIKNF